MPEMFKEVIKNLFSKPATVNYPAIKPDPVPGRRGEPVWDMDRCDQCRDCERVCPSSAIQVFVEEKRVEYTPWKCLFCHLCVENCMQQAIEGTTQLVPPATERKPTIYRSEKPAGKKE